MLLVDPAAALQECRRVLKPGGRLTLAVWAAPELNPWATVPSAAVQALGVLPPPDPTVPGPFSLSRDGHLAELLEETGFVDLTVETVELERRNTDFEDLLDETLDLSHLFALAWTKLDDDQQASLLDDLKQRVEPFARPDGEIVVPGTTFVALAHA
jgi:SAM-dependent methyltransferase